MTGELDEIAAELCSAPLAEFVSSRARYAARVDDQALAKQIRGLRKPSVAAWVMNVFARQRADQLAEALRLAAELREAQEHLDATALTELSRQRRALTRRLAEQAAQLATAQGERVTEATLESVHQTISAAFFDPGAAAAVASGRLVRALEPGTGGVADLHDVVAGSPPSPPVVGEQPADELAERRRARVAEAAVREAEKDRRRADRALAELVKRAQEAQTRAEGLVDRVAQLEADLARTRAARDAARADADAAQEERVVRAEEARVAAQREEAARVALQQLRG